MQLPKYSKRGREYECKWCPATFHEEEKLNSHMHEGNHFIKFYCENCQQSPPRLRTLSGWAEISICGARRI